MAMTSERTHDPMLWSTTIAIAFLVAVTAVGGIYWQHMRGRPLIHGPEASPAILWTCFWWCRCCWSAASWDPGALNLGLVIGPDFPAITSNLVRNIRENRLGVLSAVLTRD